MVLKLGRAFSTPFAEDRLSTQTVPVLCITVDPVEVLLCINSWTIVVLCTTSHVLWFFQGHTYFVHTQVLKSEDAPRSLAQGGVPCGLSYPWSAF